MSPVAGLFPAGGPGSPVPLRGLAIDISPELTASFRAMACDVRLRLVAPAPQGRTALTAAQVVFADVELACTRFNPTSPLMLANADPDSWHVVPTELYDALVEAYVAHRVTDGRFDPRVLRTLEAFGYDRSLPFASGPVATELSAPPAGHTSEWQPQFDELRQAVRIGPEPVDLGGIGKGLAVRWAAEQLADHGSAFLVEAGGDCYLGGPGPDGAGWRIGVEDPRGGSDPLAVLRLTDLGCATSSVRLRRWQSGDRVVHHLIDPRTGAPGGAGLLAVTVAGPDPAAAEVWSKTLFLAGAADIGALAGDLAALWVDEAGLVTTTPAMDDLVMWRADDVG